MSTLKELLCSVSPDVIVSIRGRHAVGKSEAVAQFAERMGLPLVMRRLSQMTEGDLLGMPREVTTAGGGTATTFTLTEWYVEACERPCVLFLDERNRALDTIKQSIFEICDSRQFYGRKLHPGTYVVIAENVGDSYQVQQCDPAEVSRTVTVQLEPTVKEWLDYASGRCNPVTVDFIRQEGQSALEFIDKSGNYEPNKKYPDRRSWVKLDSELEKNNFFANPNNPVFFTMACGFLGLETGNRFWNFAKNYSREVSVEDVLSDWPTARKRVLGKSEGELDQNVATALVKKLEAHCKKGGALTEHQLLQLSAFMYDVPPEHVMVLFAAVSTNKENVARVHAHIMPLLATNLSQTASYDLSEKRREMHEKATASVANTKTSGKPVGRRPKSK